MSVSRSIFWLRSRLVAFVRAGCGRLTGPLPVVLLACGLAGTAAAQAPARPAPGRPFILPLSAAAVSATAPAGAAGRAATNPAQVLRVARERLGLRPADTLALVREELDARGERHVRFQQQYRGIPVEHGVLTAHYRAGQLAGLSGELKLPDLARPIVPALSEDVARRQALAAVAATRYQWQEPGADDALRRLTHDPAATYFPTGTLTWVEDFRRPGTPPVLAWRFNIYAIEPLSRELVYVDAASGEVVLRDQQLCYAHAPGPAGAMGPVEKGLPNPAHPARPLVAPGAATALGTFATRYSGARTGLTGPIGTRFRLRDSTRGGGINTYNLRRANSFTTYFDFTDNDNNWTAAEHANAAKDDAALDAHWGTQMVYDYFRTVHGRNSYDGAGAPLISFVHFGNGFENAFWNGQNMTYGDGSRIFTPLTSLDIVGHELGHGVCEYTAHLVSDGRMRQPASLNEGFSDIWGACVEHFADSTKNIWEEGNEVTIGGWSIRSLRDPNTSFNPDTYRGQYWIEHPYATPHRNSTILSHWFYLLSQGGAGINDIGSTYAVAGLGIRRAARIAYHTEALYLTPTSNYPDTYRASLAAAADLYGPDSPERRAVANAWYAVGVGDGLPQISSLQPAQGPVGSEVLITGRFLAPVEQVAFNGVPAPNFTILDSAHLLVRVPVGATTGPVRLTAPMGSVVSTMMFVVTSQGPAPVLTAFGPAAGQRVGGTLTLTGRHLTGTTAVWIGGVPAPGAVVRSATQVTVVVPPLAVTGALTLETPGGRATAPAPCRVLPTVLTFSPGSGPVGTRLTLTGSGLTGATAAWVRDSAAALVPGSTATTLGLVVPPGAATGRVRVQTAGGQAVSVTDFVVTVSPAPTLLTFSPASGGPNTRVTLRGAGLAGTSAVAFGGGFAAASFAVENDSLLTAVVPLLARTGPITLVTPGGAAATATAFTVTGSVCQLTAAIAVDGVVGATCVPTGGQVRLRAVTTNPNLTAAYTVAPLPFAPQPEPDSVARITGWFSGQAGIPIGFPFQFFGRPVTVFNLSASANMQFSSREWAPNNYAEVPHPALPHNFISLAWSGWNSYAGGSIRYGVQGTAPNRQLVVSYYKVPHLLSLYDSLTAQIVLHETTFAIDLIYTTTGQNLSYMTVGAENSTGTIGAAIPGRGGQRLWRADSLAWRLTPASVLNTPTYAWSPTRGLSDSTAAEVVVATPTVPTTYTVSVRDGGCLRTATVLITAAPPAPPAAAARVRCGPGTVTLTAGGAPAGGTYQWFEAPTGGVPLAGATGASFTTPSLSTTTTYYVATVAPGGCVSSERAARTVLIGAPATPPTVLAEPATVLLGQPATLRVEFPQPGVVYTWRGPGLPVAGAVGAAVPVTPPTAGVATYTATAVALGGCGVAAPVALTLTVTAPGGAPVLSGFSPSSGPVGLSVRLTGIGFGAVTGVAFTGAGGVPVVAPIRARTVTSLTVSVPPGALPGALRLTYAGGVVVSADRFCVELPAMAAAGRRCGPGSVELAATGAPVGGAYRWYDSPVASLPLATTTTGRFSTPSISATRQFWVAVVAGSGAAACEGLRTVALARVVPVPVPTIGVGSSTTICAGTTTWLAASGCTDVVWNTGATTRSIIVDSSGTYSFTGTMFGMCPVQSAPVQITVTPHPVAAFAYATPTYCQSAPDPVPTVSGTPGGRFTALPAGLALDSLTGAVGLAASVPGTYQITYTATTACVDTARLTQPFTLTAAAAAPTLTAGGPTSFCSGDSVRLTAAGAPPYQWSTGDTTAAIVVRVGGAYSVVGRSAGGCATLPARLMVVVQPTPPTPTISLVAQPTGLVVLTSSAAGGNQWLRNGAPIAGATGTTYTASTSAQSGAYTVIVTDSAGCRSAASAAVAVTVTGLAAAAATVPTLNLAPNPVPVGQPAHLTIGGRVGPLMVEVRNVLGQQVLRVPLPPTTAPRTIELPTQHLAPGVYTVCAGGATRRLVVE